MRNQENSEIRGEVLDLRAENITFTPNSRGTAIRDAERLRYISNSRQKLSECGIVIISLETINKIYRIHGSRVYGLRYPGK